MSSLVALLLNEPLVRWIPTIYVAEELYPPYPKCILPICIAFPDVGPPCRQAICSWPPSILIPSLVSWKNVLFAWCVKSMAIRVMGLDGTCGPQARSTPLPHFNIIPMGKGLCTWSLKNFVHKLLDHCYESELVRCQSIINSLNSP